MHRLGPIILAALFSCMIVQADGPVLSPGIHKLELELEDGGVMRYAVHVPKPHPDGRYPLILALHYGGTVRPYYGLTFMNILVKPALEELGGIIVAPDCPGRGWKDPLSEKAVLRLLDHALENWPVDEDRVALTGFSMGGIGAWYLAGRHPERFSAVIPVSATPDGSRIPPVPVYAIHSEADGVVDIGPTRLAIDTMQERGTKAELMVLKRLTHYQTSMFVRPLRTAADWLNQIWQAEPRTKEVVR